MRKKKTWLDFVTYVIIVPIIILSTLFAVAFLSGVFGAKVYVDNIREEHKGIEWDIELLDY